MVVVAPVDGMSVTYNGVAVESGMEFRHGIQAWEVG